MDTHTEAPDRLESLPTEVINRWNITTGQGRPALRRNLEAWEKEPAAVGRFRTAWWTWVGCLALHHGAFPEGTPPKAAANAARLLRERSVWSMGPRTVAQLCAGDWPTAWAGDTFDPAAVVMDPAYPPPRHRADGTPPAKRRSGPPLEPPHPAGDSARTVITLPPGRVAEAFRTAKTMGVPLPGEDPELPAFRDSEPATEPVTIRSVQDPKGPEIEAVPDDAQLLTEVDQDLRDGRVSSTTLVNILNLRPRYGTPITAWMHLTGRDEGFDDSEVARLGRRYEAPARDEYLFQNPDVRCLQPGTMVHPKADWACSTPDGIITTPAGKRLRVLEIKHRMHWGGWGAHLTTEVPPAVLVQCAWHMWVTGLERCDVWAVRALETRLFRLRRSLAFVDRLIEVAQDFLERFVRTDTMPPADGSTATKAALKHLFRESTGEVIEATPEVKELVARRAAWAELKAKRSKAVKEAAAHLDAADAALLQALGSAEAIDGLIRRKARNGRVAWKALAMSLNPDPDQLEAFRSEPSYAIEVVK